MRAVLIAAWWLWGYAGCGLLPIWRQGRRGWSAVATGVLASFAILFSSALLLQLFGAKLDRSTWLAVTVAFSVVLSFRLPVYPDLPARMHPPVQFGLTAWALGGAVALAGAAMAYRVIAQPLVGFDTCWRWSFLGAQIVRERGLDFYPAVSAADFRAFPWPEGIPPLVSLLYAWSFMGTGLFASPTTIPIVFGSIALVFYWVNRLAARQGGTGAGLWAVALLATSPLHTWSVSIGQETGFVTLGLLALVEGLARDAEGRPDWLLAGLGAGVASVSREYGLAAIAVGAGCMLRPPRSRKYAVGFLAVSLLLAAPWYVRSWWRTGNPLYNQNFAGLFPVNEMQAAWMRFFHDHFSFSTLPGYLQRAHFLPCFWIAGAGLVVAIVATWRVKGAWPTGAKVLMLTWVGLWMWSINYTAGGLTYAMRVLAPMLALGAVGGGVALSRLVRDRGAAFASAAVVLLAMDASVRTLVMLGSPFDLPMRRWLSVAQPLSAMRGDETFDRAAALVGSSRVLSDSTYHFAFMRERGVDVVSIWSPEVAFLQLDTMPPGEKAHRLRVAGITHVMRSAAPDMQMFLNHYSFYGLRAPWMNVAASGGGWMLFRLGDPPKAEPRFGNP